MNNPYESTPGLNIAPHRPKELSKGWRLLVGVYGIAFTVYCVLGTLDDLRSTRPTTLLIFWLMMSIVTCYGIWALAIPRIRLQVLSPLWRLVWIALPILAYTETFLEIGKAELPESSVELLIVLVVFFVVTFPAFVCNWLLSERLRDSRRDI